MNNTFTNYQGCVIQRLLLRLGERTEVKVHSEECNPEELRVLNYLLENEHFAGWWDADREFNITIEYDRENDVWDIYYGSRWM